jgi:hypothetical protein
MYHAEEKQDMRTDYWLGNIIVRYKVKNQSINKKIILKRNLHIPVVNM